jgi:periplasmic protein CpxP/Spy
MKKLLIPMIAIFALTFSAGAQDKMGKKAQRGHHRHHGKAMLVKQLNFTEDQKKSAKLINEDFRKKMKDLNTQDQITVKEMRERKKALMQDKKTRMNALLTAEQKAKLAQMKTDRQAKRAELAAKRMDRMKTALNLSDDQVAKLKANRENLKVKAAKIKADQALSREQKKEQMIALKAEAKSFQSQVLTPEQLKKKEELRKNHAGRSRAKK